MNCPDPEVVKLGQLRIHELTKEDLRTLLGYAHMRLARARLPLTNLQDYPQAAIELVQNGLAGKEGRTPRLDQVQDRESFINYLFLVIKSLISHQFSAPFQPISLAELPEEPICPNQPAPDQLVVLRDIKEQVFEGLWEQAPKHLAPTITEWEGDFLETDRVPIVNGRRKHAFEVRQLVQKLVRNRKILA